MTHLTIAIDGPASSGKSTVAKLLAGQLGITYIDTGAIYRAVTLATQRQGVSVEDQAAFENLLANLDLSFRRQDGVQHVYLGEEDVSSAIRSVAVTQAVSEVSAQPLVREALVAMQQAMAAKESVVMDGRDIGTVVLPNASIKFFFVADVAVRAARRYKENIERGMTDQSLAEIEADIEARDLYDSTREHSPLKQAEDAILVDTSHETLDSLLAKLTEMIQKRM